MPHRRAATAILDPPEDFGPGFIRRNARIVAQSRLGAAQGVELADVPDITRPGQRGATTRVARRIDPLITILDLARDGPGRAQFLAAEQFRRYAAVADGIKPMTWASFIARSFDAQTPAQLLLDAQRRARQAWLAIRGPENGALVKTQNRQGVEENRWVPGEILADVIRIVVLGYQTLQVVDNARRCRHGASRHVLDVGLNRLTDHYGMLDSGKRNAPNPPKSR